MARERNATLWAQWRERVARYERSAETSAEFCRREGVSTASLFSWRRRLTRESNSESMKRANVPTFLPVRFPSGPTPGTDAARVEIELPNGAVVRLYGPSDRLLRDAIAAAGTLSPEVSSC